MSIILNEKLIPENYIILEKLPIINFLQLLQENNDHRMIVNDHDENIYKFFEFLHYYTHDTIHPEPETINIEEFIPLCKYYMIMSDEESFQFLSKIISDWTYKKENKYGEIKFGGLLLVTFIFFYIVFTKNYILLLLTFTVSVPFVLYCLLVIITLFSCIV